MKKIIFTGGGTVGHVTLNLLLIPKFLDAGWQVHYIGDKHGIEYKEIQKLGLNITFHSIATGKLRRYFSWQNMLDIFKVTWGILQSLGIMVKVRPQVLFSKGGLYRFLLSLQRVYLEYQFMCMSQTSRLVWPIKLLTNVLRKCIRLLNKLML